MKSNSNQTVDTRNFSKILIMRVLLIIILLLCSVSVNANEHKKFWNWLNDVKQDLNRAGEFSHKNEYRMRGYYNAVSTRLKTIHPDLEGALYEYEKDQHTLFLSSGGVAEAIKEIAILEKAQPKNSRFKIETVIEPSTYENFEIFLSDQRSVFTDNVRFKLNQADQKIDIELYIPELELIEDCLLYTSPSPRDS